GRRAVAVQAVGKLFVHVNDHGIFLGGVVARGIEERALQAFVVAVFVLDELFAATGVIVLEGICLGDLFRALQVWAGDEGVGSFDETLLNVFEDVGVFGLRAP